jgi:myosin-5
MKAETVTDKFRTDLQRLMETISQTDVQYVRCIKPNAVKSMKVFDRKMVVEQLRCAGMIEAIRISRAAYPYRLTHEEFIQRFQKLRSMYWWAKRETKQKPSQLCATLLKEVVPDAGSKSSDRL